jgi:hypothetical protein
VQTRAGLLLSDVKSIAQQALRARYFQRLSQRLGTKGERLFDWARLPIVHAGTPDGCHFLVVRRCLDDPHELASFLVFAPLEDGGASKRTREANKDLGLDHSARAQLPWLVSSYHSRHACLCLPRRHHAPQPPHGFCQTYGTCGLYLARPFDHLRASVTRLSHLIFPTPTSVPFICHWSRDRANPPLVARLIFDPRWVQSY